MKTNSLYDIEYFQKIKNAQIVKKRRARRRQLFLLSIVILIVVYLISPLSRINNVVIDGNNRYGQDEIKKIAQLENGQFTFLKPNFLIEKRLLESKMFSEVKSSKSLFGDVEIKIIENKLLFYEVENKKVVFYDEQHNKLSFNKDKTTLYQGLVPSLNNKIPDDIKTKLVKKLALLDNSILSEISQIVYLPKSYDKEYFRFVMSGEKEIYLNASLDHVVKVGSNYHNFSANTKYKCSFIEYIDTENKAIVKKCK